MKRDIIISVVGHALVFVGLLVPSFLPAPKVKPMEVVSVSAVTPQSISRLLTKVDRVETPSPKVPQVLEEKEKLIPEPEKRTRKVQTVKSRPQETAQKPAKEPGSKNAASKKGIELPDGTSTDQAVDSQYLAVIMELIHRNWKFPPGSDPNVKTIVFFEISRNGNLLRGVRVQTRSGNMPFDASAFQAVMKSNPFPPLPDDFEGDKLGIHLAFSY